LGAPEYLSAAVLAETECGVGDGELNGKTSTCRDGAVEIAAVLAPLSVTADYPRLRRYPLLLTRLIRPTKQLLDLLQKAAFDYLSSMSMRRPAWSHTRARVRRRHRWSVRFVLLSDRRRARLDRARRCRGPNPEALRFFWNSPQGAEAGVTGYKGFYYHFLGLQSDNGVELQLSLIDNHLAVSAC